MIHSHIIEISGSFYAVILRASVVMLALSDFKRRISIEGDCSILPSLSISINKKTGIKRALQLGERKGNIREIFLYSGMIMEW